MSEQIDEIINQQKELFLGREEEIKKFLLKHFEIVFKQRPVERLERIDATERIKTAGFQKQLSTWRNVYKNIVVTSCIIQDGKKKRFDYKFYFIEEKLDEKTIEIIDEVLKDVDRLKRSFNFGEALEKVEELLNMIKDQEDKVFNKRLYDVLKDILKAEKEHEKLNNQLAELENNLRGYQEKNNLEGIIKTCEKLIPITKKLKKSALIKKYTTLLNDTKNELEILKKIAKLEDQFEFYLKSLNIDKVIETTEEVLKIAKANQKSEIVDKYVEILKDIDDSLAEIKEKAETTLNEAKSLAKKEDYEKAIKIIDNMLEQIQAHKFKGFDDIELQLQKERMEIVAGQEKYLKFSDNLVELNNKLIQNLKNNQLFIALNYCERLIEISRKNKKEDFVGKYSDTLNIIKKRIEKLKKRIEDLLRECDELIEHFQFETAASRIEAMLRYLGQELPDYRTRLEAKRKEVIDTEGKYKNLKRDIKELDKILEDHLKNNNYIAALEICKKIVDTTKLSKNLELIERYKKTLKEIEEKIDDITFKIEELIKESIKLKDKKRFREALSKLDDVLELIGDQNFPNEKRRIIRIRKEILDAQEDYIKFTDDITELDKKLKDDLKNKKIMSALSICDLLIQISESFNNPKLIKKYTKIYDNINSKIVEVNKKIEDGLANIDKLADSHKYDNALSNLDNLIKLIQDQGIPDYNPILEQKKEELIRGRDGYDKFKKELLKLDMQLNVNIKNNNLSVAKDQCEELFKLAKEQENPELIEKYSKVLDDINQKISAIQNRINKVMGFSATSGELTEFDENLTEINELLELIEEFKLPEFKKILEEKKAELTESKESIVEAEGKDLIDLTDKNLYESVNIVFDDIRSQLEFIKGNLIQLKKIDADRAQESERLKVVVKTPVGKRGADQYEEVTKILDSFTVDITTQFHDFTDRISENLKKLHLGIIHTTAMRIINQILEEELKKVRDNLEFRVNRLRVITKEMVKK
ncbi:MAG: hypothetical protein ACTSR8_07430 [Promethearchaeota archaeon]